MKFGACPNAEAQKARAMMLKKKRFTIDSRADTCGKVGTD